MAGDYTIMRNTIHDKPQTVRIGFKLGLDVDTVVGKLLRVWAWAGELTVTGKCAGVTLAYVDHVARAAEFGAAMSEAGWLETTGNGEIRFPQWKKYNGKGGKARIKAAERAALSRARNVPKTSRSQRDESAPTEEKRRVQKRTEKEPPKTPPSGAIDPAGFARFWKAWPAHERKANRMGCLKAWNAKALEPKADEILKSLARWRVSRAWCDQNGQFIPAPLVWLNQTRWEVENIPEAEEGQQPGIVRRSLSEAEAREMLGMPGGER